MLQIGQNFKNSVKNSCWQIMCLLLEAKICLLNVYIIILLSVRLILRKNYSVFCIWMWQEMYSTSLPQRHFKCSLCVLCSSVADSLNAVSSHCQLLCPSSWVSLCLGSVLIHNSRLFCWKLFSYVHCGSKNHVSSQWKT